MSFYCTLTHFYGREEGQEQNNYDLKHPFPALLVLQFSLDPTLSSENLATATMKY